MSDVTIVGLGQMGLALAELMLKAGKTVTVWNRTAGKAEALQARGAKAAASPREAFAASPVAIVCVFDYAAAQEILQSPGAAAALEGRLVANLGTGSPEEARAAEAYVTGRGGRYLDGAIQAAPSQMGQPDTPILISGAAQSFEAAKPLLEILGGTLVYLGERVDAAAFLDLATLSYVYGAYAGFLHGARIAETVRIDVASYGRVVKAISPTFGAFFEHEGRVIASGDFAVSESPMRISVAAVRRIAAASKELGLNLELPTLLDGWLRKAEAAGLADEEVAALVKVLR